LFVLKKTIGRCALADQKRSQNTSCIHAVFFKAKLLMYLKIVVFNEEMGLQEL